MARALIYYGNPILRQKAKRVEGIDDTLRALVQEMKDFVLEKRAVGLAAPQLGESLALFVTRVASNQQAEKGEPPLFRVYINPKVIKYSPEEWIRAEGCLSIPNIRAEVTRPIQVEVEATNLLGERFTEVLIGLEARVFLHENDHLNGVFFIDRLKGEARKAIESQLKVFKNLQSLNRFS